MSVGILNDPRLEALLDRLQAQSKAQEALTEAYWRTRTGPWSGMEARDHAHYADKLVALESDKAEFCYALCRAIGAKRIVECGTSFDVTAFSARSLSAWVNCPVVTQYSTSVPFGSRV